MGMLLGGLGMFGVMRCGLVIGQYWYMEDSARGFREALTYSMYLCPTFPVSSSSLVRVTSYGKCVPSRYTWKKSDIHEIPHARNGRKGLTRVDEPLLLQVPLLHSREPPLLFFFCFDDCPEAILPFLLLLLSDAGDVEPVDVEEVDLFVLR